jgi:SAM-dependent methyltransferase
MDLREANAVGDDVASHWYYKAKLKALRRALVGVQCSSVLDVGAGSGFFSRALLSEAQFKEAVCVDPNYPQEIDELVNGKPLRMCRSVSSVSADIVLMMDVIEHVSDDLALLKSYVDMARPGTHFLITVPAFMFLWSGHDVYLEHYRRYTLGGLEKVISGAGLEIERSHYFFGAILPIVAVVRGWKKLTEKSGQSEQSDMGPVPRPVNSLLNRICAMETAVMGINRLGGTSVFALAVKR